MKKKNLVFLVIFACLLMAVGIVGCGKKEYKTFPDKYSLASVEVGGMNAKEAKKALQTAINEYKISVKLDDVTFDMNADELGLKYNNKTDLQAFIDAANKDKKTDQKLDLFKMKNSDELETALVDSYITAKTEAQSDKDNTEKKEGDKESGDNTNTSEFDIRTIQPYRATIAYNPESGQFVGVDGVAGEAPVYDKAAKELLSAVGGLKKKVELASQKGNVNGDVAADCDYVQKALKIANEYLDVTVTCNFNPSTGKATSETVGKEQIANWLIVGNDGLTVSLDGENMATYCTDLAKKHDVSKTKKGQFKTTGGSIIEVNVAASGQTVDGNKLYESIYTAIENKKSQTVDAVYSEAQEEETGEYVTYGGNYCEVDLTNQMVYVYKNGQQVVSSPCVTGCIAKGHGTPTGVYSIFSKDKDRYLRGDGYKSWVNFFVPFNGGIGFHDASWRSTFGGNIYLYGGSHGCINMPYSAVKTLFDNVSMGEKVIVYGGVSKVEGKNQSWGGNNWYEVEQESGSFKLDAWCMDDAQKTYSSDNDAIASVDADGNVTPVGVGTATITVKSAATTMYKASEFTVTVNVKEKPQPNQTPGVWLGNAPGSVTEGDAGFNVGATSNSPAQITFASSDPSVASVDANGNVAIYKAGTVQITASVGETIGWNSASTSFTLIVNPKVQEQVPATENQ